MFIAVILLLVSLWLIYLEFFLPGGVMGTAGAVGVIASLVVFGQETSNIALFFLFMAGTGIGLVLTVKTALVRIKLGKQENSLYLNDDQEGYRAPKFDEGVVGKRGSAVCDLRPAGYVMIEGKRYQVVSKSGFVQKDTEVEVIGGESGHLIVKSLQKDG